MKIDKTERMKRDYNRFFAICKTHGFDYKEKVAEFTREFTDKERDSLRALTDDEYTDLMIMMIDINKGHRKGFEIKPGDKQRKKLIGLAMTMFWGRTTEEAVKAVDQWIKKQKFKKALMRHTPGELDLMVAIFEQRVYPDYLNGINR